MQPAQQLLLIRLVSLEQLQLLFVERQRAVAAAQGRRPRSADRQWRHADAAQMQQPQMPPQARLRPRSLSPVGPQAAQPAGPPQRQRAQA